MVLGRRDIVGFFNRRDIKSRLGLSFLSTTKTFYLSERSCERFRMQNDRPDKCDAFVLGKDFTDNIS